MRLSMVEVCNGRVWTSRGFEIGNKHIPLIMMTRLCVKADASIPHLLTDGEVNMKRLPGKKRKAMVFHFLKQGTSPQQILEDMHQWDPVQFWAVVNYLEAHNRIYEALQVFQWWKKQAGYKPREQHYTPFMHMLRKAQMPILAQNLFDEMRYEGIQPTLTTMMTVMLCYAESGFFAQAIWDEIAKCGFQPDVISCIELIQAYGKMGLFDEVARIFNEIKSLGCILDAKIYTAMIICYGKGGQLGMMENMLKEMVSSGFRADSPTLNSIVQSYSFAGSLTDMEESYRYLKAHRILIEKEAIRAMAFAYIQNERFYQLGEFVRDVGLRRKNTGNLLWNLLLLSYAANFKMRSLQREFQNMMEAGYNPNLTTFNIRALAFSRMQMFWDLHITVLHMQHMNIAPDLVTYGAVVDAYLNGKLVKKLSFALGHMQMQNLYPDVLTDPLVFEAFGKGDFHVSAEILLQYLDQKHQGKWTYSKLLRFYLKKYFRKGQLFWNH